MGFQRKNQKKSKISERYDSLRTDRKEWGRVYLVIKPPPPGSWQQPVMGVQKNTEEYRAHLLGWKIEDKTQSQKNSGNAKFLGGQLGWPTSRVTDLRLEGPERNAVQNQ